jgi:hypothetical protein
MQCERGHPQAHRQRHFIRGDKRRSVVGIIVAKAFRVGFAFEGLDSLQINRQLCGCILESSTILADSSPADAL